MSGGSSKFADAIQYGLKDFTTAGNKLSLPQFLTDDQLYTFNKQRFNFYQQLLNELSNPNSQIAERVFAIANRNRLLVEKLNDAMAAITKDIGLLRARHPGSEEFTEILNRVNNQFRSNIFLKDIRLKVPAPTQGAAQGGAITRPTVEDLLDEFHGAKMPPGTPRPDLDVNAFNKFKKEYEAHPIFTPENTRIVMADRVVFIAITFVFRGISLFLTEWAMNSFMIAGFQQAIVTYFIFYCGFFLLLVLLANSTNDVQVFRMAFYYVSTKPNGFGRILLHLLVQLILLPVPFVVKESSIVSDATEATDTSFAKRRSVMRVLSNFTLAIWILTSAIAIRY